MADQWVEMRPALGRKNRRHRLGIGGIRTKPVNRLGAERDQLTFRQQARRRGDVPVRSGQKLGHSVHRAARRKDKRREGFFL